MKNQNLVRRVSTMRHKQETRPTYPLHRNNLQLNVSILDFIIYNAYIIYYEIEYTHVELQIVAVKWIRWSCLLFVSHRADPTNQILIFHYLCKYALTKVATQL